MWVLAVLFGTLRLTETSIAECDILLSIQTRETRRGNIYRNMQDWEKQR